MKELTLREVYGEEGPPGFARLLGMLKVYAEGDVFAVSMTAGKEHTNGNGTVHGGVLYALADQAAGASVTYKGRRGIGMDGVIRYYRPAYEGDVLTAYCTERKSGRRIRVCSVEVKNAEGVLLADASFTGIYAD